MRKKTIKPKAGEMAQYNGKRGYFPINVIEVIEVDDSYLNASANRIEKTKIDHYIVAPVRGYEMGNSFRAEMWEVHVESF